MREQHPSLREYGALLRRRWWLVAAVTVATVAMALAWSLTRTERFGSTVSVLVDTDSAAEIFDPVSGQSRGARAMANEGLFAESFQVRAAAAAALDADGYSGDPIEMRISATEVDNADVLELRAEALTPENAALVAQTFADVYIELRREQVVSGYLEAAQVIQSNFDATQDELEALGDADTSEVRILESQLESFGSALSQLDVSAELGGAAARVIEPAGIPVAPFAPRTSRNVSLAVALGALLGVTAALVFDAFDTAISNKEQIEQASAGLANLAVIPTIRDWKNASTPRIVSLEKPDSSEAESYRLLRAALEFATLDSQARVLQVTSANAGEGKTTTVANLAIALARSGKRVIVVDCDLRKPRLHAFYGLPKEPGFTNIALGNSEFKEACRRTGDTGRLGVLPSGALPPGPSEFLGTRHVADTISDIADQCDIVLIDSPPVLPVSDALVLSTIVDGTILVANAGSTSRPQLTEAVERLRQVDAGLLGTVLNQVRRSSRRSNGYGYGDGYTK